MLYLCVTVQCHVVGLVTRNVRKMEIVWLTYPTSTGQVIIVRTATHGAAWQRCQFHLQQNASAYVPKKDMKKTVASDIRDIFNAKNLDKAEQLLEETIRAYQETAPKLAQWMDTNLREGFSVFSLPKAHRIKCRTSNPLERVNREVKRRTAVWLRFFPTRHPVCGWSVPCSWNSQRTGRLTNKHI